MGWVGSAGVVEGSRQLEMGANVECEELDYVVGGPFKPNKLREVQGLVWRPWINKPSEMTMRSVDICHHTTLVSVHIPPQPSLCPVSHMSLQPPPSCLPLFFLYFWIPLFFLTPPPSLLLLLFSLSPSHLLFISPQRRHPSIRTSLHAWLAAPMEFSMW